MKSILSPKITELTDQLSNGDTRAFHTFLDELKANETPLIETCPMNNQYHLITYIWLGDKDTENIYVFGSYPGWDLHSNRLERLSDTNLWYKTFRTNKRFISIYHFSVNDYFEQNWIARSEQYQLDPFNSHIFGEGTDRAAVLEIGMEMQYDKRFPKNYNPQGKVETYSFYSSVLGNTRKIYIYTPHDYSLTSSLQNLILTFDGNSFMQNLSAPATLNHLIHKQEIPSCIVVGIEHVDRLNELTYNDKMNAFLIEELLPWIQTKYHVYKDPAHATIAGLSLGGLAAFYAALQNPHVFGNVLSLSGSVHWKKDGYEEKLPWMEKQFLSISNTLRLRMYMAAGTLENEPLLQANRSLYKALREKEYQIIYSEFQGGHDEIWWREQLAEGLLALNNSRSLS
ncbi:alpha/beta hydrolase [Bacillus pseudomycoides]|uniref:Enterochelin esterase n=1 Tax=Bacillus pseudomycoides TaxID=64104 RepID=A0AAJ1Z5K5_9BACI|nr:alpha/beta hydrolase-fold protein [Bacillus pseudomycoides]MDR4328638.1 enterochelin esterase [Bacillus pseudomycoides]MED1538429.1 alpha/beta hydrolase-fold protein [Bacillus pseudomycoides]PEF22276.1 enterochelin esterase [Bacillus pseudomycoides]PFY94273.1 enterochelin esterase [Bacillus pseudomycoides]PFZ91371.1 enterochelin esterase [Bacillus pseudomycoides]